MTLVVGWVGNYMRPSKNFDIAYKLCMTHGYELRIAGPNNTFLYIPHEEMPTFYKALDLLLITSSQEAHPLVAYEALACGKPVFIQKNVGDCFAEKMRGVVYYEYADPEVIHDWIEWANDILPQLGRAGRRHIEEDWKWSDLRPKYDEMFIETTHKKQNIKVLITVDTPGWAWDFMAKELRDELLRAELYDAVDIIYTTKTAPEELDHGAYDVILNHTWSYYNSIVNSHFPDEKNIACANGPAYGLEMAQIFDYVAPRAAALTSVSRVIARDLRRFRRPVYHCSRGVNIDVFKP
jgi:hypothetical protein